MRGATSPRSFECLCGHAARLRPVVPQRLRPRPSSLKGLRARTSQCAMQATGPVLEDRSAVRPALGYSVQPVHWTGALALITLVFTVQPVQVAQSHTTHHTPTPQHHTPHTTALLLPLTSLRAGTTMRGHDHRTRAFAAEKCCCAWRS